MFSNTLSESNQTESKITQRHLVIKTQQAQEKIYHFLLGLVRKQAPAKVLVEFKNLFIEYQSSFENLEAIRAIYELLSFNNEKEFHHTLKRSCYILVNNWDTSRNYSYIKELIELLADPKSTKRSLSQSFSRLKSRLKAWLSNFVYSQDYQELKLFISKYGYDKEHWSSRYTSYLLVPQYTNLDNPVEQREAARTLSKKLKDKFKFELAMYTARSQSPANTTKKLKNPTALGDEVLRFIKMIVVKRGAFSYINLSKIFLEQTTGSNYDFFKMSLQKYLIFSVFNQDFIEILNKQLAEKLEKLYQNHHEEQLNEALLLRTCNKVIEYLITENQEEPSPLFVSLLSQGNHLTLVIVLLKIILICPNARSHLETCIAQLIQYYINHPEIDCQKAVNFFEVFQITFAIHADNVQYNLIKMNSNLNNEHSEATMEGYRIFSQLREGKRVEREKEAKLKVKTLSLKSQKNNLS
jgi:hypothetical protein